MLLTQLTKSQRPDLHGNICLMNARSTRQSTQQHPVRNYNWQHICQLPSPNAPLTNEHLEGFNINVMYLKEKHNKQF